MAICHEENCHNTAQYNFSHNKIAKYCNIHSVEGMRRIGRNTCKCGQYVAQYNYENLPAAYCKYCKSDDMININNILCKCRRHKPSFNYPFEIKPEYCKDCKLYGMIKKKRAYCSKKNIQ